MADWGLAPLNASAANPWGLEPTGTDFRFVPPSPKVAQDIGDAFISGMQDTGLARMIRGGKEPEMQLSEDAPWQQRAMRGFGSVVGDFVPGVVGALAATPGGVVASGAAGFAVPMALREAVVTAYANNAATDWASVVAAALKGAAKGGVIGAATMGAGRFAGGAIAGGAFAKGTAAAGAELTAMTATASALERHVPTWQDFMDNAILLGGLKGVVGTAKGLYGIYAQTGKHPTEVLADAAKDPALKAELMGPPRPDALVPAAAEAYRAAQAKVDALLDKDAAYSDVLAARKEKNAAKVAYDKALDDAAKVPSAYAPLALEQRIQAALDKDKRGELVKALMDQQKDPNAKVASPVKYDYIFDKETADGLVRDIAEVYNADILKQTRGEVKVGQSMAEAQTAIAEGKLNNPREVGSADNSGIIAARALLAKGAAENAQKLAETLPRDMGQWTLDHKLQWAGAMEQVSMLYGQWKGAGAEAARSLNMMWQLKRDPGLLANAETMVKLFEKGAKTGTFAEMAAMVRQFKDPEAVRAFAEKLNQPSLMARFVEPWRAGIFSGPMTWEANLMGNVAKWAIDVPRSVVGATITAARRALNGDPLTMEQYKVRALAPLYGLEHAVLDGLHLIAEGKRLVEANGWKEGAKTAAKRAADAISREDDRIDVYKRANQPGSENVIESAAGYFSSAAFGMLKLQDMPFRTIGERQAAIIAAVDRVTKEGSWDPRTKEWHQAVARYVKEPTLGLTAEAAAKITEHIQQEGAKAVFGERLGPTTERLSAAISGTAWEFVFPARRTPANLLSWAIQHAPGLNFLSGRWREDFAAGGERRDTALARVVVGTALAATALGLVKDGMLTGGGLMEKEEAGVKSGAGQQPYSLVVDGKYYSIQRMEPVAKLFMLVGDMAEIINSPKTTQQDKEKASAMMVLAFGNATISTTYLSGLANGMRAVLDPQRYGNTFVEQYASSLVPKIIGQPVVMSDPYKREVDGVFEAIQSQMPLLREKLHKQIDVWGEPSQNNRWFDVLPVATSEASKDKVKTEAVRLSMAIGPAPKYVQVRGPLDQKEERIKLEQGERNLMREVSGKLAMELLTPLVNHPDWERLPNFAQRDAYRKVLKMAGTQGAFAAMPPDDPRREAKMRAIIDEVTRQQDEAATR